MTAGTPTDRFLRMTNPSHATGPEIFAALAPAGLGVFRSGSDGKILEVNASYCKMLGYSREELLGRHFAEITHPDDVHKNIDGLHQLVAGEIPSYSVEKRYIRKDKTVVWASLFALLIKGDKDVPDTLFGFIEDITE